MKEILRDVLSRVFVGSGLTRLSRTMSKKPGAVIYYGHRVEDNDEGFLQGLRPSWFDAQLAYLTRNYEIISLQTLVACFELQREVPHNSVVLTFDDGFRDNYTSAFQVLKKYHCPATVFLTTGCLEDGELPWSQRLGYIFQQTDRQELEHSIFGLSPIEISEGSSRKSACQRAKKDLAVVSRDQRNRTIRELGEALEVEPPRDRMLTWDQTREMSASDISFGGHTYSHPYLAKIPADEARWEVEKCRSDLEENLGITRPSFCFPGGSRSADLVHLVRNAGFRSLFQSRRSIRVNNLRSVDAFSLSRIGLPNAPARILEAELHGPFHMIRSLYRG